MTTAPMQVFKLPEGSRTCASGKAMTASPEAGNNP